MDREPIPPEILAQLRPEPPDPEKVLDRFEAEFLRMELVDLALMGLHAWKRLNELVATPWPGAPKQEIGKPVLTRTLIVFSGRPGGLSSKDSEVTAIFDRKNDLWGVVLTMLVVAGSISWTLWPQGGEDNPGPSGQADTRGPTPSRYDLIVAGKALPDLPNLESASARNALVHVEAKTRGWLRRREAEKADSASLSAWSVGRVSPAPSTSFRFLNPKTWDLTVNEHTCNLAAMAKEMQTLTETLEVQYQVRTQ